MNTDNNIATILRNRAQIVQRVIDVRRANDLPAADMVALHGRLRAMAEMAELGIPPRAIIRQYAPHI